MTINRSKDRIKTTGEVFTPLALVDEILDKLPPDVWQPEKTFIDPACGDGNFLVRILQRKLDNDDDPEQAISTIFGVDIMPDNIKHCRQRLLQVIADHYEEPYTAIEKVFGHIVKQNIVCHDALTYDYSFGREDPVLEF